MQKVYISFDTENFVNAFSYNDTDLTEAYMEDDFEFTFGYTKVKEEDGLYYLYNVDTPRELYIPKDNSYEQELINSINEYKYKLNETDYVVVKITEAQALGEDISPLLEKYTGVLSNRKECRAKINELEQLLEEYNGKEYINF